MKKIALGIMASVCLLSANYLGDKKIKELNNMLKIRELNHKNNSLFRMILNKNTSQNYQSFSINIITTMEIMTENTTKQVKHH